MTKKRPALNDTVMVALRCAMHLVSDEMEMREDAGGNPDAKDWARAIQYIAELDEWYRAKKQKKQKMEGGA